MDPNKAHMFKPSLNYNGTAASVRIQLKLIVCALSPSNIISCQTKQQCLATMALFGTTPSGSGSAVHNTVAPLFIEAASLPPFPPLSPTSHCSMKPPEPSLGGSTGSRATVHYSARAGAGGSPPKRGLICAFPQETYIWNREGSTGRVSLSRTVPVSLTGSRRNNTTPNRP